MRRTGFTVSIEKGDPAGELGAVCIARANRTAAWVDFSHDMHRGFGT